MSTLEAPRHRVLALDGLSHNRLAFSHAFLLRGLWPHPPRCCAQRRLYNLAVARGGFVVKYSQRSKVFDIFTEV